MLTLRNCGAISAKDRGTTQIGVMTIPNGLEESLSMMIFGVTLAIAQVTLPVHASPHLSKSFQKEKGKPKVSQASLAIVPGKAKIFPPTITLSKPHQLSMMKRLPQSRKVGGKKASSDRSSWTMTPILCHCWHLYSKTT